MFLKHAGNPCPCCWEILVPRTGRLVNLTVKVEKAPYEWYLGSGSGIQNAGEI